MSFPYAFVAMDHGLVVREFYGLLYLAKRSLSSCSEQKGPRLATKRVVQGSLLLLLKRAAPGELKLVTLLLTGLPSKGLAAASGA